MKKHTSLVKFLALSLCALLAFALVGCSNNETPAQTSEAPSQQEETEASETPSESASTETSEEARALHMGIVVMDASVEYFVSCIEGAQYFCDERGYQLTTVDGAGTPEKQVSGIESMIQAKVDAVDIRSVDGAAMPDVVKQAKDAGVAVSIYPDVPGADMYLKYEDKERGYALAAVACEWINEKYDGKVEIALITMPENESVNLRSDGFKDAVAKLCPESEIVTEVAAFSSVEGLDAAETVLQAFPDVKVFLCINDGSAIGVDEAIIGSGRDPETMWVGGVDADEQAIKNLQGVKDGTVKSAYKCTIGTSMLPQSITYAIMEQLENIVYGRPFEDVVVDAYPITPDNVEEFLQIKPSYEQ